MLSPTWPLTPWILGIVLAALLAGLVLRALRKDRREYQRFKRFETTAPRQRMFRKWLIASFVTFGGASVIVLLLAWQFVPLLLDAVRGWPVGRWFSSLDGTLVAGIALGVAVVLVGGTVLLVYLARNTEDIAALGDVAALLPRNRAELRYGGALSLNAGLVEELLFRLALPALIFGVSGNATVAVVASVVIFGLLHAYQGVPGVVGTLLIGGLLMAIYLATGSILAAIVAHALIDLRSLVLIPVVVYRVHRRVGDEPVVPASPVADTSAAASVEPGSAAKPFTATPVEPVPAAEPFTDQDARGDTPHPQA
ncbi:MAG: family intrarane metalloprotease protein [Microbacteriaceae bacterium]|nr:family intrarane metalloprotease protein [Microbacteriaceae bacterium]